MENEKRDFNLELPHLMLLLLLLLLLIFLNSLRIGPRR
jgi:hypothetical protein